jgi:phosphotriesterase-related protein
MGGTTMARITTVCGDISPDQLGMTSMHEHTLCDLSIARQYMLDLFPDVSEEQVAFKLENYAFLKTGTFLLNEELAKQDDEEYVIRELGFFKELGGRAVCDCAPIGVRGNIEGVRRISKAAGLHIVCATGIYTTTSRPPELLGASEDVLYTAFKREIEQGIDGTDIKPGFLKSALATYGSDGVEESELAGVRACARLSVETGMSMHIHTGQNIADEDVVAAVDEAINVCGAHPDRILVCHTDTRIAGDTMVIDYLDNPAVGRNISLEMHRQLLDRGVNIGLDTWGMPVISPMFFMPDDFERLKALVQLCKEGYAAQIVLGDDMANKFFGRQAGNYGCTRWADFAVPQMPMFGLDDEIEQITIENPARILAY